MAKGKSMVHKLDKETRKEHFRNYDANVTVVRVTVIAHQPLRHARSSKVAMMQSTGARNSADN